MKSFYLLFIFFATFSAAADEPAEVIRTVGRGEIEKVSDYLIFSSSKKFAVQVPGRISTGDSFPIQYTVDGKIVTERFTATEISIRGDLCWLHSKMRTRNDNSSGDTIYVQPCQRAR